MRNYSAHIIVIAIFFAFCAIVGMGKRYAERQAYLAREKKWQESFEKDYRYLRNGELLSAEDSATALPLDPPNVLIGANAGVTTDSPMCKPIINSGLSIRNK